MGLKIRTDLIRRYKTLHTWTGIIAGFGLFIAFYGGALSMFKEPIADWASPTRSAPLVEGVDRDALFARVVEATPDFQAIRVHMDPDARTPGSVVLPAGRDETAPVQVASLDGDGTLQLQERTPTPLAEWIDLVHRTGGIPGDPEIGIHVMGIVSALYALALVSGVIVLLPTLAQDLLALRIGRNRKRMWLDAHNLLGVASLPFHLIMVLSAVVFAFHHEVYDLQDATIHRDSPVAEAAYAPLMPQPVRVDALLGPGAIVERMRTLSPEFTVTSIDYRGGTPEADGSRAVTAAVQGYAPNRFLRGGNFGVAFLDAGNGQVIGDGFLPGHQRGWSHAIAAFFALHFGNFGGPGIQWAYFLLGLIGAAVFYTGNLLWVESRRKIARNGAAPVLQTRSARNLAAATVGVSLGCVIGLSATIAAAHWITGRVDSLLAWHQGVYWAAFVLALGWAMGRGAATAAAELLRASAVVTALIPAITLLAQLWPAASALDGMPRGYAVELVAALAAAVMWWLAGVSARRAARAPVDSVWSDGSPASASSAVPVRGG
ncbi:MAG: PepSY-associated TM helix domain-containing protein [Lysobacter sp.]